MLSLLSLQNPAVISENFKWKHRRFIAPVDFSTSDFAGEGMWPLAFTVEDFASV